MKKTEQSIQRCVTISTVQKILGGKWKIEILYYIGIQNIHRFGELRRHIGDITESSLTKQLRELEADGFINRYDFKEVPPHVEYTLTPLGESFMSVLEVIKQWGDLNLKLFSTPKIPAEKFGFNRDFLVCYVLSVFMLISDSPVSSLWFDHF